MFIFFLGGGGGGGIVRGIERGLVCQLVISKALYLVMNLYFCTCINLISLRKSSDYGTNTKELLFTIQAICAAQFLPLVLQNLQPSHY